MHHAKRRGQTIIFVLIAAVVGSILVASAFSFLPGLSRQREDSKDYLENTAILGAFVGYLTHAIQNLWVIDLNTGAPVNSSNPALSTASGSSLSTFIINPGALERFLLSDLELYDPHYGLCVRMGYAPSS